MAAGRQNEGDQNVNNGPAGPPKIPATLTTRRQDLRKPARLPCRPVPPFFSAFNTPPPPDLTPVLGLAVGPRFPPPAGANGAYFVAPNLTFPQDQQPSRADIIKEVMGKYGVPTIVGDQHLY